MGFSQPRAMGAQGGPLLSNILLDDLDRELRGHAMLPRCG
jgi:hypothetical protein